jgi:hypothetical protein
LVGNAVETATTATTGASGGGNAGAGASAVSLSPVAVSESTTESFSSAVDNDVVAVTEGTANTASFGPGVAIASSVGAANANEPEAAAESTQMSFSLSDPYGVVATTAGSADTETSGDGSSAFGGSMSEAGAARPNARAGSETDLSSMSAQIDEVIVTETMGSTTTSTVSAGEGNAYALAGGEATAEAFEDVLSVIPSGYAMFGGGSSSMSGAYYGGSAITSSGSVQDTEANYFGAVEDLGTIVLADSSGDATGYACYGWACLG